MTLWNTKMAKVQLIVDTELKFDMVVSGSHLQNTPHKPHWQGLTRTVLAPSLLCGVSGHRWFGFLLLILFGRFCLSSFLFTCVINENYCKMILVWNIWSLPRQTKRQRPTHVTCSLTWVSMSSDRVLTWSQDPRSYRCTLVSTGTAKSWHTQTVHQEFITLLWRFMHWSNKSWPPEVRGHKCWSHWPWLPPPAETLTDTETWRCWRRWSSAAGASWPPESERTNSR